MPRTEAQKRAQDIYASKFDFIRVRVKHRTNQMIKAEAERQGQSVSEYALQAIKERMARDKLARLESPDIMQESED